MSARLLVRSRVGDEVVGWENAGVGLSAQMGSRLGVAHLDAQKVD